MKSAYRHPANPIAPGTAVDPSQMVPVTDLGVKSVIAVPGAWAKPGPVRVQGTAWSNSSPIAKVDVSTDGGQTWKPAKLGGRPTQYGWRLWQLDWKAAEGKYTLMSRATNAAGQSQPVMEQWNPNGYLWNVAQPVETIISATAPPAPGAHEEAPEAQAPEAYKT